MQDVKKEILTPDVKKSSTKGSISATVLKKFVEVCWSMPFLAKHVVNHAIHESVFQYEWKRYEKIPVFKFGCFLCFCPVNILPYISKVFERLVYKQINDYIENKLSTLITGFWKSHGTQHIYS